MKRPHATKSAQLLGVLLLMHFVAVCWVKLAMMLGEEIFWISHISLALAGVGLITRSTLLPAIALTCVLMLHSLWIVDCLFGLVAGVFPIGVASYVAGADAWGWLGTIHHFYLVPLLLALLIRRRACPRSALVLGGLLFAALTVTGRLLLPPESNVNYAVAIEFAARSPLIRWVNGLKAVPYLFVLNALVTGSVFLPAWVLLQRVVGASPRIAQLRYAADQPSKCT